MKIYGEIAILYTANNYGDMWQVGLDQQGRIDLRKSAGVHAEIAAHAGTLGLEAAFFQSNHKGALIDRLHERSAS